MKLSFRTNVFAALALSALALAGCDKAPVAVQEVPQVASLGCPVATGDEMQRIFRGVNGVDDENRPLNDHAVPVDVNGNCLSTAPVPFVYSAAVSQVYQDQLRIRYGYSYYYQPSYVHVIVVPGVVYRTTAPTGRVILTTSRPAGATIVPVNTVTVRPGATTTVRPGAPAAAPATTVTPGNTSTVKPGAPAAAPVAAPAATPAVVAPPKAAAPSSLFNRTPAAAPAPYVAPARPAAPAPYVAPARSSAPSMTFSRPSSSRK